MKITPTEYTNTNTDILIAPELAFALPCIVSNAGVTANADGRKIIKAGTPLYASADYFMNRQTLMKVTKSTESSSTDAVYGVARWDIDVTDEEKTNATLLIAGFVDYLKLDSSVQTVIDTAKTSLTRILFVKGRKA